jgi:capsid protein
MTNTSYSRERGDSLPLLPSDLAKPEQAVVRAAIAHFLFFVDGASPEDHVRRSWPRDTATRMLVQRAAVSPTDTTAAAAITRTSVGSFIASLRPVSAAGRLIDAGTRISLDGQKAVVLPGVSNFPVAPFVAESGVTPTGQPTLTSVTLGPVSRIGLIVTATKEWAIHAAAALEDVLGALLREAGARALDAALFSATAASTTRPAGLIAGLSTLTPTTGGGVAALAGDTSALIDELVTGGGGAAPMLFMSPGRAARANILAPGIDVPVIGAPTIAASRVIAVDAGAFAWGFSENPDIDISDQVTVHEETNAQAIGVSGSPTVPIRSMWQTASIAIRLNLRCTWALRAPAAFIDSPTW